MNIKQTQLLKVNTTSLFKFENGTEVASVPADANNPALGPLPGTTHPTTITITTSSTGFVLPVQQAEFKKGSTQLL